MRKHEKHLHKTGMIIIIFRREMKQLLYITHEKSVTKTCFSGKHFSSEEIIIINLKTWEEMMFLEREGNKRYFDAPEEINGTLMLMLLKHRQQSILDRMFLICHFRFVFFFFGVQRMALSCNISLSN